MAKLNVVTGNEQEKTPSIENKKPEVPPADAVVPFEIVKATSDLPIEKTFEFEMFALWYSIPTFLKNPMPHKKTGYKPDVREFCEEMGIDDERVIELAMIPTMTEFCAAYNINKNTATEWKKLLHERDLYADLSEWTKPLTKNVMMSLYAACLRGGFPDHYKLWLQTVNGWSEKTQIDIRKRTIKTVRVEIVQPKTA